MLNKKPIINISKLLFCYLIISIIFGTISLFIWDVDAQLIPNIILFLIIIKKRKELNLFKIHSFKLSYILLAIFLSIINFIALSKILYLLNGFKIDYYPSTITSIRANA